MSIFNKIFKNGADSIIKGASDIIDKTVTSDGEKSEAKAKLSEIVLTELNKLSTLQAELLKTEMTGNWLQRSWRPLSMLVFVFIIAFSFFKGEINEMPQNFWDLFKLGFSGFLIGRTAEKITGNITKNIDIPFIKKKKRDI